MQAGDLGADLNLLQDLALLKDVAREAGQLALDMMREGSRAWDKSPGNPVTEADLAVNDLIAARLRGARPEYGWLSEETKDNPADRSQHHVWVVDPIDGTISFVHGVPLFGTLIGVERVGQAVGGTRAEIGVIHMPALGETAYAASGVPMTTAVPTLR